jgi:hypothetical protein
MFCDERTRAVHKPGSERIVAYPSPTLLFTFWRHPEGQKSSNVRLIAVNQPETDK